MIKRRLFQVSDTFIKITPPFPLECLVYDYEMYEWAVGDGDEYGENGCAVLFDCLPEEAGHYVMCYYSYKLDCIISVSDPFEVRHDS